MSVYKIWVYECIQDISGLIHTYKWFYCPFYLALCNFTHRHWHPSFSLPMNYHGILVLSLFWKPTHLIKHGTLASTFLVLPQEKWQPVDQLSDGTPDSVKVHLTSPTVTFLVKPSPFLLNTYDVHLYYGIISGKFRAEEKNKFFGDSIYH